MKAWIHKLGSMPLAIGVLVVIVVALAVGTVIESIRGAEVAARLIYGSLWFRLLLGMFAVNLACSLIDLWPWGRARIGFVMTHGSILLTLIGALATDVFKIEGRLAVWEGEERQSIVTAGRLDAPAEEHALPFSIHLDAFEIDYYPGTRRPAMFRSRVTVIDPVEQRTFPAIIEMNRELSYAGYHMYQSSYQQTAERDQTILLVSRDPGQLIVFVGYTLMMVGMTTVLVTRIAQRRGARRALERQRRSVTHRAVVFLASLALLVGGAATARAASTTPIDAGTIDELRALPVQHDGRVMPLDTLAREATLKVTGGHSWNGLDPVAVVLGWTFDPDHWANQPLVEVGGRRIASAISLPAGRTYASFSELVSNPQLMALFGEARAEEERGGRLGGVLEQAQELEGRLIWMQGFLKKGSIRPLPSMEDPDAVWSAPDHLHGPEDLLAVLAARPAAAAVSSEAIEREVTYNSVRPSRLSWWILVAATVLSLLAWNLRRGWLDLLAMAGLLGGFAVMTWGLAVRWQIAGRIPASNMYESLLFLAWGVGLFALVALIFLRNRLVVFNAAAMSALTMALADLLPIDPFIHPMPPVLSGTAWLAIHVPIIMVSYSVLALGVLIAHMQIGIAIVAPQKRELAARMNDLLYWYMHVGAILLIAGILTGSIWAASSWGRYWGWDPKEVWSLVAFLAYLAILHGRFDRLISPFGVAVLSIVAFWTIVMTYIGVNYVLAAGLHSYGFGGSGVVRWMMIVAVLEGLFLVVGWLSYGANRGRKAAMTSPA
jgi:cytochrome c-type biogenesis protein CcsB